MRLTHLPLALRSMLRFWSAVLEILFVRSASIPSFLFSPVEILVYATQYKYTRPVDSVVSLRVRCKFAPTLIHHLRLRRYAGSIFPWVRLVPRPVGVRDGSRSGLYCASHRHTICSNRSSRNLTSIFLGSTHTSLHVPCLPEIGRAHV